MRKVLIIAAAILLLTACQSDITGVNIPESGSVAGAWSGTARWTGTQGLGPGADGAATAAFFQSGSSIVAGSTWQITGVFTATVAGTVDEQNNVVGTTTVTVLATLCQATAPFGGSLATERRSMSISVSFSDPGVAPCAGAPVGLVLSLSR